LLVREISRVRRMRYKFSMIIRYVMFYGRLAVAYEIMENYGRAPFL
jgi:hypothetical protein